MSSFVPSKRYSEKSTNNSTYTSNQLNGTKEKPGVCWQDVLSIVEFKWARTMKSPCSKYIVSFTVNAIDQACNGVGWPSSLQPANIDKTSVKQWQCNTQNQLKVTWIRGELKSSSRMLQLKMSVGGWCDTMVFQVHEVHKSIWINPACQSNTT